MLPKSRTAAAPIPEEANYCEALKTNALDNESESLSSSRDTARLRNF